MGCGKSVDAAADHLVDEVKEEIQEGIEKLMEIPDESKMKTLGGSLADVPTGSIILMSGTHVHSAGIKATTLSPFSHSCVFIQNGDNPQIFSADSLTKMEDCIKKMDDPMHSGAHLLSLKTFMANIDRWADGSSPDVLGKYYFAVARLKNAEVDEVKLNEQMFEMDGMPFPEAAASLWDVGQGMIGVDSGRKDAFCSEAVADLFQRMGWLSAAVVPNAIWPRDFDVTHSDAKVPSKLTEPLQLEAPEFFKLSDDDVETFQMHL